MLVVGVHFHTLVILVLSPNVVATSSGASTLLPTRFQPATRFASTGNELVPVPLKLIICGLPIASLVIVTAPFRIPEAVGLKVTLIMQLAEAASDVPQSFVDEKSPLETMFEILIVDPPVLVSVTLCAELEVLCAWLPKVIAFTKRVELLRS